MAAIQSEVGPLNYNHLWKEIYSLMEALQFSTLQEIGRGS